MPRTLINDITRQLNELETGSLWFDQSFRDKLGTLSDHDAFARPIPEVHSVAEHVSHMLEWRKECILRFKGLKRELMNSPEDWKDNEELKNLGWQNLRQALYDSRADLVDLFKNQDDEFLKTRFQDTEYNFHYLIEGILQHDLYHLGQIGVTIKLLRNA
ncbi:MAG TPA: DinB family protein [Cyclobacteriaceae bacterium]|nr:DinB family protein [Cyclobacteriaceae bacterium]